MHSTHPLPAVAAAILSTALLAAAPILVAPDSSIAATRSAEAEALHRRAMDRLVAGTIDARRQALAELERSSLLDPGRLQVWLDLGRLCLESGQRRRGRSCYERARRVAPDDPEAHLALGFAWTWEWLSSFEDTALARAQQSLARATALAPASAPAWGRLAALDVARGQVGRAAVTARRGCAADPGAWEPIVALGCASYRAGALARADSAFRAARARLPGEIARRFADPIWARDAHDAPPDPLAATTSEPASWEIIDPDLTTPENEAALDHATRLGLALLLFQDAHGVRWDMRSELFVRYGPPAAVDVNPLSSPLAYRYARYDTQKPPSYVDYRPQPISYPFNAQVWSYPDLGFRAELWDRALTQSFELPPATESDPDPRPDPRLLAGRPDLVSLGQGRGVFRAMAPGSQPVPVRGHIARFPADGGAILVAHVVTPGEPADTLQAAWAVVGSDGRVIARGSGPLSGSACDPAGQRVADFTVAAPAGDYRVDLSVSGPRGRRGLVRLASNVPTPAPGLSLSDLVLSCGPEGASLSPGSLRIEPDLERRVRGSRPLAVYFEMDRLVAGADGRAHFAYTYSITSLKDGKPARVPVAFEASREEVHEGMHRRQLISVPMRSIRSGSYQLRVEVRDLVAATTATGVIRFERE